MNAQDADKNIARFIYETGIHAKTPRSGLWLLGSGEQSVAEHLFHTAMIVYALAYFDETVDKSKAVLMALFHDIGEGRTSDQHYVSQRYGRLAENEAVKDLAENLPFGSEIVDLYAEEQKHISSEARLVKDADTLEWIVTLRSEEVKGNTKANEWIQIALKRLKTESGKRFGDVLLNVHPDSWWYDMADNWFVDRKK